MNGYYILKAAQLIGWLRPPIFEIEFRGEILELKDLCIVREARLVHEVKCWNKKTARLCAADFAEHVLPLFENVVPNAQKVIEAARQFAKGEITDKALKAARVTVYATAYARRANPKGAAYAAAYAARAAAEAATWDTAWVAVARAAGAAAIAARAAAKAAAKNDPSAAAKAAWNAERKWQTERLSEYLNGERG